MNGLKILTMVVASLLAISEIGRWWGDPRMFPLALDELLIAVGMLVAAFAAKRFGPAPLAAAWGCFCGLIVSLLVVTVDHLFYGPPKDSAVFYAAILSVMMMMGLWAMGRALALCLVQTRGH